MERKFNYLWKVLLQVIYSPSSHCRNSGPDFLGQHLWTGFARKVFNNYLLLLCGLCVSQRPQSRIESRPRSILSYFSCKALLTCESFSNSAQLRISVSRSNSGARRLVRLCKSSRKVASVSARCNSLASVRVSPTSNRPG